MLAPPRDHSAIPGAATPRRPSARPRPAGPAAPDRADEAALVRLARAGDATAFAALVGRYQRPLYAFIYRLMGDADDAADLLQDVLLKAYRALPRIDRDLNVGAWLHRIAANACLDVLRRRQRIRWLTWDGPRHDHLLLASPLDDPERQALSQETRAVVQRVLNRMSHRHRLGLILRAYEGLTCAEVGQVMGISRSATKSMLFRARDEFKRTYLAMTAPAVPGGGGHRPPPPAAESCAWLSTEATPDDRLADLCGGGRQRGGTP